MAPKDELFQIPSKPMFRTPPRTLFDLLEFGLTLEQRFHFSRWLRP